MMVHSRSFDRMGSRGWRAVAASLCASLLVGCTTPVDDGTAPMAQVEPTPSPITGPSGGDRPSDAHALVLVKLDAGRMTVSSVTRVAGRLPVRRGDGGPNAWSFRVLSPSGQPLHATTMGDPTIVRGSFSDGAGRTEGTQTKRDTTAFTVRVPLGSAEVEFYRGPIAAKAGTNAGPITGDLLGRVALPH